MELAAEHFALLDSDREDDRVGPWLPLEVVAPWADTGSYGLARIRRIEDDFQIEAHIAGGEPGSVALQMPAIIAPDHDQPRITWFNVWMGRDEEAPPRQLGPSLQVLAGGAIRVWPQIEWQAHDPIPKEAVEIYGLRTGKPVDA